MSIFEYDKEKEEKKELSLRTFFMSQPVGEGINIEHGKRMREKFQGDFVRFSGYNRMTDGTVASTKGDLLEPYEGTNMDFVIPCMHRGMEQYIKWLVFLINVRRKMESL